MASTPVAPSLPRRRRVVTRLTRTCARTGVGAVVGTLAALALAGCGGSDADSGDGADGAPESPSEVASSPSQPAPTQDTSPASPTESPTSPLTSPPPASPTTAAPASGPVAALLDASAVPGLSAGSSWRAVGTIEAGQDAFGTCQRFDLPTVGASRAVQRTFASSGVGAGPDTTAAQQVVVFPDFSTARRVTRVLTSWHDTCAAQIRATTSGATGISVGAQQTVALGSGAGSWYLVRWQPAGGAAARYEAFGLAVVGKRMALLRMDGTGSGFPSGGDPMVGAVGAAGAKLAG